MSDRKQFLIVMLVAAVFVGWLGWRGFEVISLNQRLQADPVVADYPYLHRVLRIDGDVAVISSLRSHEVATQDALKFLYPSLGSLTGNQRDWQRAERELAHVQARAGNIILTSPAIARIRWELDENWYHLSAMRRNTTALR